MKRRLHTLLLMLTVLVSTASAMTEGQIAFTYADPEGYLSAKKETYDLAIRIGDASLVGTQINGVRIYMMPEYGEVSRLVGWLSSELKLDNKNNAPDIVSADAAEITDGWVEIVFDEPYTITEAGVYAGYSFTVSKTSTTGSPIAVGTNDNPDGLYIHSSSTYRKWINRVENFGCNLALQVILSGENVKSNSAAFIGGSELNVQAGVDNTVNLTLKNFGTNGVQSVDFTYALAGKSGEQHVDLPTAIPAAYNGTATIPFTIPAIEGKGVYTLKLTVTKVNGADNEAATTVADATVKVYTQLPRHRAVMEEYTGTWCGYCPRGFMGLEEMNRLYPDDFIAISYHNGDPMEITSDFPNSVPGFPDAWLDRVHETDAFCGDGDYRKFGIEKTWLEQCAIFAPASVEVSAEWEGDNALKGTAHVVFPFDEASHNYQVGFVLIADGLTGTESSWRQSNYYGGETGWPSSMDAFVKGGSYVSGLSYNDVIIARSGKGGIAGSLPESIKEDEDNVCIYTFDLTKAVNTSGVNLVQDKSKLRIVALLINAATGEIVNANKANAGQASSTGLTTAQRSEGVASVRYYDLQGRIVTSPQHGLFLRSETLGNGKSRVVKEVR